MRIENVVDGSSNKICPNDSVIGYLRGHSPLLFVVRANFVERWVELVGRGLERRVQLDFRQLRESAQRCVELVWQSADQEIVPV